MLNWKLVESCTKDIIHYQNKIIDLEETLKVNREVKEERINTSVSIVKDILKPGTILFRNNKLIKVSKVLNMYFTRTLGVRIEYTVPDAGGGWTSSTYAMNIDLIEFKTEIKLVSDFFIDLNKTKINE